MAGYTDLLVLKATIGATNDSDDAALQLAIDAASRMIDQYTGRSFTAETAATKYLYPRSYTDLDLVPDIRTVTSVAVDTVGDLSYSTTFASTDYIKLPLMPFPDSGIYNRLQIAPTSSQLFYPGLQVKIVGDWGYTISGYAPAVVEQACLLQASRLFKRRESPFGILQSTDLGTYTRISKADPDVMALLQVYRHPSRVWVMA